MQHQLNADVTAELSHSAAKPDHIHPRLAPVRRFIGDELLGIAGRAIDGKVDDFCGQIISPQYAILYYRTGTRLRRLWAVLLNPPGGCLPRPTTPQGAVKNTPPCPEPLVLFG
jgi:hypothetical protein